MYDKEMALKLAFNKKPIQDTKIPVAENKEKRRSDCACVNKHTLCNNIYLLDDDDECVCSVYVLSH